MLDGPADARLTASEVAHEFNNALGVVLGYVELARSGLSAKDEKVREHLDRALATLERAMAMADRLLNPS
jgi:signal transduction histidine kinase